MAAVLSNNMSDIKQVTFFMEECKRMGLAILGPDVNESFYKFSVNDDGAVRFGMGAIKGVGANAVATIVAHRKDGKYKSIFDLAKRIDLRAANKKAFENLAIHCNQCTPIKNSPGMDWLPFFSRHRSFQGPVPGPSSPPVGPTGTATC